jgi:hypothetical protein
MANRQWHERFRRALYRRRLPAAYVDRLVEELTDHATDLFMETNSMDAEMNVEARLGSPEHLATVAKSEYRRRTFAGRHPVLTFVAGPIVAIIGTITAICLTAFSASWLIDEVAGGIFSTNDELGLPPTSLEMGFVQVFNLCVRFVPFAFSTWLFVRLGRRAAGRGWCIASCGMIALVAIFVTSIVTPANATAKATWSIGLGSNVGFDQIVQAVVPLVLGAWMLWQSQRDQPKALALE